jgi:hypothetical protein
MKSKKALIIAFLGLAMAFSLGGCIDDNYDIPTSPEIPLGHVMTIEQLKDLCPPGTIHRFVGDTSVVAVVTMDDKSGNLYKEAYIQDATGGVVVRITSPGGLYQGDSIYINLNGTILRYYRKVFQIDSVHVDNNIVKRTVGVQTEPELVTIPQLSTWDYQAKLIRLENVQFVDTDTSKTYADADNLEYVELTIQDEDGGTVILRSSGYAKFARQNVPNGNGSIVAVAGRYDDIVQLAIRSTQEVQFDGTRFTIAQHTGSFDDPYTVMNARQNNTGNAKWVEGYLVGVMETNVDPFVSSFTAPFFTNSNVIIADSPFETSISNCLIVQLPVGDIRTAVNLVNNASNLGKVVKLRGNLTAYFSSPGMRDTDGYWLDGSGVNPEDQIAPFYEEQFTTNLGTYTAYSVEGSQAWVWGFYDGGCVVMSGYEGSNFVNNDWLVSAEIDLSTKSNVNLRIREAVNYSTNLNNLKVLISSDYNGTSLPTESGTWTELTGFSRPAGNSWTFFDSEYIDVSQYDGQSIHIALQYLSTASVGATWEVSRISLTEIEP